MTHRIREAMKADAVVLPFTGRVISDETYIGGPIANRKNSGRPPRITHVDEPTPIIPGEREKLHPGPGYGKTIVMSLIDETTGEVRSRVIPDVTGPTLCKSIAEHVNLSESTLITDENRSYQLVATEMADHQTVNHSEEEYVRYDADGIVSTNRAESFFAQLKRSIDGTHHHVYAVHLPRYLAEFDYPCTTRNPTDSERMKRIVGQVSGRRLAYRPSQG